MSKKKPKLESLAPELLEKLEFTFDMISTWWKLSEDEKQKKYYFDTLFILNQTLKKARGENG